MLSCNRTYSITEFGGFTRDVTLPGYQMLPENTFNALEAFILANNGGTETDALDLLSLSAKRGIGKIITARNFVGVITMSDGTVIEILPKIAGAAYSEKQTRSIFLEMLRTLDDVAFKEFNMSSLHADRLNLLELFIKMFIDEVTILTKQGLKSAYVSVEANERFYKGRLLPSQNIKHNLVNPEKFFVRFDDFQLNRPENRIIKTTLEFLRKTSGSMKNRQRIAQLLSFFDGVESSKCVGMDLNMCIVDRGISHYSKTLSWCKVFLRGNSFTAFAGSEVALALLFPMETVFENYVAALFRKHVNSDITLKIQDKQYHLFDNPNKEFSLRPDLVLEFGKRTIVLDTKWKLLSDSTRNSGIAQSDMYQMYAYSKKYDAKEIVMLYPKSDEVNKSDIRYSSNDCVHVRVSFLDLMRAEACVFELLERLRGDYLES